MKCRPVLPALFAACVPHIGPHVVPQFVITSLRSHLDLVAFTEDVPRVRKYLTTRFAAPNGKLTPEVEAALDRESVS